MSCFAKLRTLFVAAAVTLSAMAAGQAVAVPTLTVDSPTDGATVDVDYTLVSGVATAVGGGAGVDLMLVMDDSGSLSSSDPTRERFEAVRQLLRSFGPDADVRIGMVFFSSSASVAVSLTDVSDATMAVELALTAHASPGGLTAIGDGIAAASQELSTSGRASASHVIVVFTDGENTTGSDPESAASSAASASQVVNVVGLGSDASYQSDMDAIASAGGGVSLSATAPDQLIALFRDARIVGISGVTITNTTTGATASRVNVVAGSFSASVDLAAGDNAIRVVATDTGGETATSDLTVTYQSPTTPPAEPERRVKLRPQVLMAGFDPMLLDIVDSSFNIVAVVREGAATIQNVSISENTSFGTGLAMTYAGDLSNGDKVYTATYTYSRGSIPIGTPLQNLFGSGPGEYNVSVTDTAQQTHAFPNLEYGNNPDVTVAGSATVGTAYSSTGPRRSKPQPLVVGFDPVLLDFNDVSFDVKAIVRAGLVGIQHVTLRNGGAMAYAMRQVETLANGDEMYAVELTFPRGFFPVGSFRDLFGAEQASEFLVEVVDTAQQTHSFPTLEVGNYPAQ